MMIQMTGLSGSGKSTLANRVKEMLSHQLDIELFDGDVYRKTLCKDLGFSKEDRFENIRRLAKAASLANSRAITIIAAINPFESIRNEVKEKYGAKTAWIKCDVNILLQRDTKGLYKKALLADDHPDKIFNLTGINDDYEIPVSPDLVIDTGRETITESIGKLYEFILKQSR